MWWEAADASPDFTNKSLWEPMVPMGGGYRVDGGNLLRQDHMDKQLLGPDCTSGKGSLNPEKVSPWERKTKR